MLATVVAPENKLAKKQHQAEGMGHKISSLRLNMRLKDHRSDDFLGFTNKYFMCTYAPGPALVMIPTDVDRKQAVITTLTTLIGSHYFSRRLFFAYSLVFVCLNV
jgi:hypothetical protein